ncbi:MAG: glucose-6-phosphate dehydrogenase [Acidobacteria bacterium]|nr:glucose-6-phosphate dehydrogenase [Acidobacteriota bacterium]
MVIFGATGDLAARKLLPALYNLATRDLLPDAFTVVGVGRKPMSDDEYRQKVREDVSEHAATPVDDKCWAWFVERLVYAFEPLDDESSYQSLSARLDEVEHGDGDTPRGRLFYLATPPDAMSDIIAHLGAVGLTREPSPERWRRVIVEKPFGHDLASAQALNQQLRGVLEERQIYRIDHYLGKETVQNLMAFRFANGIFEPIWNRRYIDHVQITVAETVGVEDRGGYYDKAGALRDMVQNHLFQLLALTAMEPPISFRADDVRDERVRVLHAIHLCSPDEVRRRVVRGQYAAGTESADDVRGYRDEPKVAADSTTETFVAMKMLIENWRWADVPFYLRTGKRLEKRVSEIAVQFRRPPMRLFGTAPGEMVPNDLIIRIQPDEGISLHFQAKVPGTRSTLGTVEMSFDYADYFSATPATGYETLLYDCMHGDPTLFHRADMVEAGWDVVAPILELMTTTPRDGLFDYPAGSWGPTEAETLLARDGRTWRVP